jgi:glycosyltransferase involved in cell wall biosynthesis
MRILLWHVHGSWTTAFVQGDHDYVVPVVPDRGPDGVGRARTWEWPDRVVERRPDELRSEALDAVVLQRPHEIDLVRQWTGRIPGADLPAVYLEHNAPTDGPVDSRHPLADQREIPIVHVTHFNRLFWDCGRARVTVIEHGIVDPGARYTGELPRVAAAINEPVRRGRVVGTDLLASIGEVAPVDLFGMSDGPVRGATAAGNQPQDQMHSDLARRRVYFHSSRWTSLGLSLLEAMHLAMPVVVVDATEAGRAVPTNAGAVSCDLEDLRAAVRYFVQEPEAARLAGKSARAHALEHYGLPRFLADWDELLLDRLS